MMEASGKWQVVSGKLHVASELTSFDLSTQAFF